MPSASFSSLYLHVEGSLVWSSWAWLSVMTTIFMWDDAHQLHPGIICGPMAHRATFIKDFFYHYNFKGWNIRKRMKIFIFEHLPCHIVMMANLCLYLLSDRVRSETRKKAQWCCRKKILFFVFVSPFMAEHDKCWVRSYSLLRRREIRKFCQNTLWKSLENKWILVITANGNRRRFFGFPSLFPGVCVCR